MCFNDAYPDLVFGARSVTRPGYVLQRAAACNPPWGRWVALLQHLHDVAMSLQEGLVQPAHGACDVILLGTLVEACRSPARTVSGGLQHVSGGVCYYDGGGPVALLTGWAALRILVSVAAGRLAGCSRAIAGCFLERLRGRGSGRRCEDGSFKQPLLLDPAYIVILYSQLAAPCLPRSKLVVSVEARLATSCFTALRRA